MNLFIKLKIQSFLSKNPQNGTIIGDAKLISVIQKHCILPDVMPVKLFGICMRKHNSSLLQAEMNMFNFLDPDSKFLMHEACHESNFTVLRIRTGTLIQLKYLRLLYDWNFAGGNTSIS